MTPQEIVDLAIEYRTYYNTRDARIIAKRLGFHIIERPANSKAFQAHIIRFNNMPPFIALNSAYTDTSKRVLCAHELGHALLHESSYNQFATTTDQIKQKQEYEANLFAVAFLCNESEFEEPLITLSNYALKSVLDYNIKLSK